MKRSFILLIVNFVLFNPFFSKAKCFRLTPDSVYRINSGINISSVTPQQGDNLAILAKIWGFLKYHHPVVASGKYNWDNELFLVMPEILSADNPTERNVVLANWIKQLGGFKMNKVAFPRASEIKLMPDLGWINENDLGKELNTLLDPLKEASGKKNFYVSWSGHVPEFTNESGYPQVKEPDAGFRLLSLFRYWNIIQYYFPYKNLTGENWQDVLREYIPKFIRGTSLMAYKRNTISLICRIHDSHSEYNESNYIFYSSPVRHPAIEVRYLEKNIVVTDFYDDTLGRKTKLRPGDILTAINGVAIDSVIKNRLPYVSASNDASKLYFLSNSLLKTDNPLLEIGYKRDNIVNTVPIETYGLNKINIYKNFGYKDTCFKFLNAETAYFNPSNVKAKYIPGLMKEIVTSKYLIIDLRGYPKESIIFEMGRYLFPAPTDFTKLSFSGAEHPGLFIFGEGRKVGQRNANPYKGKIILLVNEKTQSHAEFTAMAFKAVPNSIVIGSQTSGADGNVIKPLSLPGNIVTRFSGIGIYYPDGTETQRIGIVPDIEVKPTIKGVIEGRDEVLEMALTTIQKK